jgi:phosphate transport system permease protein
MNISRTLDQGFVLSIRLVALLVILLVAVVAYSLWHGSAAAFSQFGWGFLKSQDWNPVEGGFGAFQFILGTLVTSFLALMISIPFSISIALYLGEFNHRGKLSGLFTSLVELLAGIPSVIYGFWALFYLVPAVRWLQEKLDFPPYGVGLFTAALILSIMIIPFSASLGREVVRMVPKGLKESAYALGATRFEVIKDVVLPVAKSGIFAGIILSLGRALGETMAVTMVIGNNNMMPDSLFAPGNTIASLIANEFAEADNEVHLSALILLGLVLFLVTGIINLTGKLIIRRLART